MGCAVMTSPCHPGIGRSGWPEFFVNIQRGGTQCAYFGKRC